MERASEFYEAIRACSDLRNCSLEVGCMDDCSTEYDTLLVDDDQDIAILIEYLNAIKFNGEAITDLEKDLGITVVYTDQYRVCGHCYNQIVEISPTSYFWTEPYYDQDGCAICKDCTRHYQDDILEDYANKEKSLPGCVKPSELGLSKVNTETLQNGLHKYMDDSPKPIIKAFADSDIDVYFTVKPSQFYVEFDVWVKSDCLEQAKKIYENVNTYQGYSGSEHLKQQLQNASILLHEHLTNNSK